MIFKQSWHECSFIIILRNSKYPVPRLNNTPNITLIIGKMMLWKIYPLIHTAPEHLSLLRTRFLPHSHQTRIRSGHWKSIPPIPSRFIFTQPTAYEQNLCGFSRGFLWRTCNPIKTATYYRIPHSPAYHQPAFKSITTLRIRSSSSLMPTYLKQGS